LSPPARGHTLEAAEWLAFGLWDHAFRADGSLYDGPDEADHVCGADSRRFYIGLSDPARTSATVEIAWKTTTHRGAVLDDNAGNPVVTLARQPNGTYLSEGLLLVADDGDRAVPLWSARAGATVRSGGADHRVRRASMFGDVVAQYPARGAPAAEVRVPVFQRSPDARRRIDLELCVLDYTRVGSQPLYATTDRVFGDLQSARDTYERIGVWLQPVLPRFDPSAVEPRHRPVGRVEPLPDGGAYTVLPFPAGASPTDWRSSDTDDLASSLPPLPPHTMRALYVRAVGGDAGNATTDRMGHAGRGHLCLSRDGRRYTLAHEIGHVLLDMTARDSHYEDAAPPPHRLRRRNNLMSTEGDQTLDHTARKRIWDAPLYHFVDAATRTGSVPLGHNQYRRMRASPYLR
jgi:hypothetical protein